MRISTSSPVSPIGAHVSVAGGFQNAGRRPRDRAGPDPCMTEASRILNTMGFCRMACHGELRVASRGPSVGGGRKLLLVHQFELPSVSGVTVMVSDLLRLIPAVDHETDVKCQSYQAFGEPGELVAAIRANHADTDCVVGINLHIEVGWDFTLE